VGDRGDSGQGASIMQSFGLNETLENIISGRLEEEIFTALPGIVIDNSKLASEQSIIVRPAINKVYNPDLVFESPLIFKVPVVFPAAGGGMLSFPIQNGDTVLLIFSKRSIDDWLLSDGTKPVTPSRNRVFSLSDAVAIPGLFPIANNMSPDPENVELKLLTQDRKTVLSSVKLKPSGAVTIDAKSDITATSDEGEVSVATTGGKSLTLKQSGEVLHHSGAKITDDGDFVTASGISLDDHIHSQPNTTANATVQGNTGAAQ